MSSLGKIQAALASATQETTVALANANFDFSLIKVEAPAEYRQLGTALTTQRRMTAEHGQTHVTAMRLGSLFHAVLPETPRLIKAYGKRVSEIAADPNVNPQGTLNHGPFQDFVGVDGTTIWAAATSGPAAIAAHLLACLLAAHWPPAEAVAIWEEIVVERKRQLEGKLQEDVFRIEDAVGSQLSLDRSQLSAWDSSARAWLNAAQESPLVKDRQKALLKSVKSVRGSVNQKESVLTSVLTAWKLCLETFENVLNGTSYSIQDGAVVLALVSWHIYPDLVILGEKTVELQQTDPLCGKSAGVLTIGQTGRTALADESGVH